MAGYLYKGKTGSEYKTNKARKETYGGKISTLHGKTQAGRNNTSHIITASKERQGDA